MREHTQAHDTVTVVAVGPLPAKELVDKLMTEEGYSVTAKDSKVAVETTSPSTSSVASLPWSAEEQKVGFKTYIMWTSLVFPSLATREGFTHLSSVGREQVG